MATQDSDTSAVDQQIADFRRDGYLVVPSVLPAARIAELLDHLKRDYPGSIGAAEPGDFFKVGDRRIISPIRFAGAFECADIAGHPVLVSLLDAILGAGWVFEAFGVTCSLPGADAQHIHRDGGVLFPETGIDQVLPASAVTVMIPLVDMDEVSGSTMFWPGSHRKVVPPDAEDDMAEGVTPVVRAGSIALWDFRVRHGGRPNLGDQPRPLLYFTACRPYWMDHKNFVPGRNAKLLAARDALDRLDDPVRQRFVRAEVID